MARTLLSILIIVMIGMFVMPGKAMAHSGYDLDDQPVAVAHDGYDGAIRETSVSTPAQTATVAPTAQHDSTHRCPAGGCAHLCCCGPIAAISATAVFTDPRFKKTAFSLPPPEIPVRPVCGGQFRPPESFT